MKKTLQFGIRLVLALGGVYWLVWAVTGREPLVLVAEAGAHAAADWVAGERVLDRAEEAPTADWALVLGTSARGQMLKERCQTAAALFHAGKVKHLLLSGDGRHPSYDEPATMRKLLVDLGVPNSALTEDPKGLTTYDSLNQARAKSSPEQSWLIVTQPLHAARTALLAKGLGLEGHVVVAGQSNVAPSAGQKQREARATIRAWLDLAGARRWTQACKNTKEVRLVGVLLVRL